MEERIIKDINNLLTQLFLKMKEAGYEWNAEKKELKKIEYQHICELDNSCACVTFPFKAKVKSSGTIVTIHDGQLSLDGKEWIKYQSDAEDKYKVYEPNDLELVCEIEQKPGWSEEDEKFVHGLIRGLSAKRDIHGHTTFSSDCIDITETINWLNSLKYRYTWKLSDEQMDELEKEHLKSVPKY